MAKFKRYYLKLKDKYLEESKVNLSLYTEVYHCDIRLSCIPLCTQDEELSDIYYSGSLYLDDSPVKTVNADNSKDCYTALKRWLFEHYKITVMNKG